MPPQNITEISIDAGSCLCPLCHRQKRYHRLYPVLLSSTRGIDIPLFCRHCKTEFIVEIRPDDPTMAHVTSQNTKWRK